MKTSLPKAYLLNVVQIDRDSSKPLYLQIYQSLRQAIITGQLKADLRLPSTRDMAELFSVSRNTVMEAMQQLISEGYLETSIGSGTHVTSTLPDDILWKKVTLPHDDTTSTVKRTISQRGELFTQLRLSARQNWNPQRVFSAGTPDLDAFPFDIWSKLIARHYRERNSRLVEYNTMARAGYPPLLEAIADYARSAGAVRCEPDQIVITNGGRHAIFLASMILLNPGDKAWMEEPGHPGIRMLLQAAGAQIIPVPVDAQGLNVDAGLAAAPDARLVVVTPRQVPVGSTMSLKRRADLLHWANQNDAWIIEDDYDQEFNYVGHPLMSLQGLDANRRVIYVGTFSKSMFPGLRLGYMIVPPDLAHVFAALRVLVDVQSPFVAQAALNDFIREGHFSRHVRRMRALYAERRTHLLMLLDRHLGDIVTVGGEDTGIQMTAWLPDSFSDLEICAQGEAEGLDLVPASRFYIGPARRNGLVLGYSGARLEHLTEGVQILERILRSYLEKHPQPQ